MNKFKLPNLAKNIITTLLRQVSSILVGLLISILLARALGPEGNGIYALAILLPTLLSTILNLGIVPANVYFISRGDISIKQAFKASIFLSLIISILGMILGIITIIVWSNNVFPNVPILFLLISLIIFPIIFIQSILVGFLQAIQDFNAFNKILLLISLLNFVIAFIAILIFKLDILGGLIAYIISQIIGLLLTTYYLQPYLEQSDSYIFPQEYAIQCIQYGWKAYLSNIIALLNYRIDIFLVNFFLNPTATGIYVIAVQIVERLWIISQAVSTVILPYLSKLHTDEEKRRIVTPIISRWVVLITLLIAILLGSFSEYLINLLFGSAYKETSQALLWLLPGVITLSFARILANDIAARGKPELNMFSDFIVIVINTIANIILIPSLGINGASISTTIAYSVNALAKLYIYTSLSHNKWWETIIFNKQDLIIIKNIFR